MSDVNDKPSPGPWRWDSDRRELTAANSQRGQGYPPQTDFVVLSMPEDYSLSPSEADARLIADAPAMLGKLKADAALIMDLMNWFMARESRKCPCCEERGGAREDGTAAAHAPFCRLRVQLDSLRALLDKHGRG